MLLKAITTKTSCLIPAYQSIWRWYCCTWGKRRKIWGVWRTPWPPQLSESSRPNISLQSHSQHLQHLLGGSLGQEYGVQERLQDWSVKKGINWFNMNLCTMFLWMSDWQQDERQDRHFPVSVSVALGPFLIILGVCVKWAIFPPVVDSLVSQQDIVFQQSNVCDNFKDSQSHKTS